MKLPTFIKKAEDGKYEMFLDSHMLGTFGNCPTQFMYQHVMNLRPKGGVPWKFSIGTWWSETMAEFYTHMSKGPVDKVDAINIAIEQWIRMGMDNYATWAPAKYTKFGGSYISLPVGDKQVTIPSGAVNMMLAYYDEYYALDKVNWKVVACEAGFGLNREFLVGETMFFRLYWIGRIDLVVYDAQGRLFPVDFKTHDYIDSEYDDQWKPNDQLPGYCRATELIARSLGYDYPVTRFVICGCGRQEPAVDKKTGKKKLRFKRVPLSFSAEEFDEWHNDTLAKASRIFHLVMAGSDGWWEMNKQACHVYDGCTFKSVDRVTPSARPGIIKADFVEAEPWSPYKKEEVKI